MFDTEHQRLEMEAGGETDPEHPGKPCEQSVLVDIAGGRDV